MSAPNGPTSTWIRINVRKHGYESEQSVWTIPLNEAHVVASLLTRFGVKSTEKERLSVTKVSELASTLKSLPDATAEAKAVAAEMAKFRDGSAYKKAIDILADRMPEFLYFSSYDRMDGRVQLEALEAARAATA